MSLLGSVFKTALPFAASFIPGGSTLGKIAQFGAAGLGSLFGAKKAGQADKLQQERLAQTRALQGDRNTLRAKAMARLGNIPQSRDLGSLFAGSQNPFARGVHIPAGGTPGAMPMPGPEQMMLPKKPLGPLQVGGML